MKVFRIVKPEARQGRGFFWRPGGSGYTNEITGAGLFEPGQRQGHETWTEEPAEERLLRVRESLVTQMRTVVHMLSEARGETPEFEEPGG